ELRPLGRRDQRERIRLALKRERSLMRKGAEKRDARRRDGAGEGLALLSRQRTGDEELEPGGDLRLVAGEHRERIDERPRIASAAESTGVDERDAIGVEPDAGALRPCGLDLLRVPAVLDHQRVGDAARAKVGRGGLRYAQDRKSTR